MPTVEVRRRVTQARDDGKKFFVKYEQGGVEKMYLASSGESLGERLTWWEERIARFRTYDPNYSPCRH